VQLAHSLPGDQVWRDLEVALTETSADECDRMKRAAAIYGNCSRNL
jgi:hypothetical protein